MPLRKPGWAGPPDIALSRLRRPGGRLARAGRAHRVSRVALQREDQPKAGINRRQKIARDLAGSLRQYLAVHGYHLRHIGDRIPRQTRRPLREQNVTGGINEGNVRGQDDGDGRIDPTAVEGIRLHDQQRPAEAGLRAARLIEVRPPDFAALDYHSPRTNARPCARRTFASSPLGRSP